MIPKTSVASDALDASLCMEMQSCHVPCLLLKPAFRNLWPRCSCFVHLTASGILSGLVLGGGVSIYIHIYIGAILKIVYIFGNSALGFHGCEGLSYSVWGFRVWSIMGFGG